MLKPMERTNKEYWQSRSPLIAVLRRISTVLPGEYLKTAFYLNCIDGPRRALRQAVFAFYRFDHVYAVLRQFQREVSGGASILEFGTSDGYAFAKLLYATRYLGLEERVAVHTFDSFEGMPVSTDQRDQEWVAGDNWVPGEFRGRYPELCHYCREKRYRNSHIHRGYFEQTLDSELLHSLAARPPILVWIDCDYYTSARVVIERLIDCLPNGCVIYFDELDNLNFGTRLTGEARIVHELNSGVFGENIELVPDPQLSLHSRRIYRFFRLPPNRMLAYTRGENTSGRVRLRGDGSPLP
ncbi:MAG TPA: class I SAM-dependent methyltransferase [Steroidobacteraceae bacterium]